MPKTDLIIVVNRHIDNPIYMYHKVRKALSQSTRPELVKEFAKDCKQNMSADDFIETVRKYVTVKCLYSG